MQLNVLFVKNWFQTKKKKIQVRVITLIEL